MTHLHFAPATAEADKQAPCGLCQEQIGAGGLIADVPGPLKLRFRIHAECGRHLAQSIDDVLPHVIRDRR